MLKPEMESLHSIISETTYPCITRSSWENVPYCICSFSAEFFNLNLRNAMLLQSNFSSFIL